MQNIWQAAQRRYSFVSSDVAAARLCTSLPMFRGLAPTAKRCRRCAAVILRHYTREIGGLAAKKMPLPFRGGVREGLNY